MDYTKMTKDKLIEMIKDLKIQVRDLECEVTDLEYDVWDIYPESDLEEEIIYLKDQIRDLGGQV